MVYGPASAYAGLMPSSGEIECVFLAADAELRSSQPLIVPDLVVLDLDFLGPRADPVRSALASLDPSPRVVTVGRTASPADRSGPLPDGEERLALPRDRDRQAAVIAQGLEGRSLAESGGGDRLVIDLPPGGLAFDDYERRIVRFALDRHGWNRSRTARELGISRPRLQRKIDKYGLSP